MKVTVDIACDSLEDLILNALYQDYETVVWGYLNSSHTEDILRDEEVMDAIRVLVSYYTYGDTGTKKLDDIYANQYSKHLISQMGITLG